MAARRGSESASPPRSKPYHGRSRRSRSSSLSTSPPRRPPPHSLSPRSKRLKRAKEALASAGSDGEPDKRRHKDFDKRDHRGRSRERQHHDAGREKYYDGGKGERERENDRTKNGERSSEKDRSEKYREKDGKVKLHDRRPERRSPKRFHRSRSSSPRPDYHKGSRSSPRGTSVSSPSGRHRFLPEDRPRAGAGAASAAGRAEEVSGRGDKPRANVDEDSLAKMMATEAALEAKQKEKNKPSFEYSGKLAAETNRVRGVTLLFTEPPEARKPTIRWRLYVFKEGEPFNEPLYIHRQSCYLFGRERRVADIPTDHISCSKQHAVIQYRLIEKEEADGIASSQVRPYVMDLGSTNGTFLNGERLESHRYYELYEKDTIKFGNSSREYVLLHENSTG